MHFTINLASQPYEAARQFRRRMGAAVAALALVAVALVGYIVYQRVQSRTINQQLSEAHREIDNLNREEAQARAILNRPENRDVAEKSEFLNQLFARKALSWTRVFTEMERIMPPDLHVVSMKPEYNKTNDLTLRVVVATGSRGRAVELVRRMEKSNHFRQSEIVAENVTTNSGDQSAGPGNIQFDITALYLPSAQDANNETTSTDEEKDKTSGQQQKTATMVPAPAASMSVGTTAASVNSAQNQPRPARERSH
ncbi:MAG TPA: PilN domain-containing protein [Terriglobales bacterium]|nr:PilN domain-containing protein [Terriglobales bacterium]